MKNIYWTIRCSKGRLFPHCSYTRKVAIAEFLSVYANGKYADKSWAWHKRNQKVSVVKVEIKELPNE